MAKVDENSLKQSIVELIAAGDTSPKKILKKMKSKHPKASKSEITRAAFAVVLETADNDLVKSTAAHAVALDLRNSGSEDEDAPKKQKKSKKAADLNATDVQTEAEEK